MPRAVAGDHLALRHLGSPGSADVRVGVSPLLAVLGGPWAPSPSLAAPSALPLSWRGAVPALALPRAPGLERLHQMSPPSAARLCPSPHLEPPGLLVCGLEPQFWVTLGRPAGPPGAPPCPVPSVSPLEPFPPRLRPWVDLALRSSRPPGWRPLPALCTQRGPPQPGGWQGRAGDKPWGCGGCLGGPVLSSLAGVWWAAVPAPLWLCGPPGRLRLCGQLHAGCPAAPSARCVPGPLVLGQELGHLLGPCLLWAGAALPLPAGSSGTDPGSGSRVGLGRGLPGTG